MKIDKNKMKFLAPPDDAGGGSPVADLLDAGPEPEVVAPVAEPAPAPAPTIDAVSFAKEFATHIAGVLPKAPAEPVAKPLTPEEAKKLLNVWEPDDAFVTEFGNMDTQKAAFAKMRDAFIRQSDTITQVRLQEQQRAMEAKYEPVLQYMRQQEESAREARFGTAFPEVAKPELRPLIAAVAADLSRQGKTFADESSLFKALASGVEAVIKVNNPEFKLTAASAAQPKKSGSNPNAIPVTTPGSGGGGGNAPKGAASGKGNRALAILGSVGED